jgi:hypothetical protein
MDRLDKFEDFVESGFQIFLRAVCGSSRLAGPGRRKWVATEMSKLKASIRILGAIAILSCQPLTSNAIYEYAQQR